MAAKARRADKGVLSRQDIAARRQKLVEKKLQTGGTGKRAIVGVFALAFSLLALLSVATFDAHDRTGPGYRNAIGPMGHLLGDGLRGMFGICAYVIPLAGLWASAALLLGRVRRRWPQWVSLVLLTVSGSVLAQLAFGGDKGWAHPPGGGVGEVLGALLSGLFSTVGTIILVSAVCVTALIVGTQFVFLKLCAIGWSFAVSAAKRMQAFAVAFLAKQKESMSARAEERAKAKEEEKAFLAQLEADEEELLAAEREVAEAEAIAEEADRLEREAIKKREEEAAAKRRAKEEKKAPAAAAVVPLPVARPAGAAAALPRTPAAAQTVAGEPAWVSALLPANNNVLSDDAVAETLSGESTTATAAAAAASAAKRGRKTPNIVTADSVPPATALAEVAPASTAAVAASAAPVVAPAVASAAAGAGAVVASAPVAAALARTPLIVEPKAPPKPTAALAKKKEPDFQMLGGRTAFTLPPTDFLDANQKERSALDKEAFLTTAEKLRAKLADFGIVGEVVEIRPGPVVTMYEFLPGPGIKVSKIAALQDDLAMAMEAMRVRIVAPIPGKGVVGIEVPNKDREMVFLKEIAEQDAFTKSASRITMCVGKDIEGMPYVLDLAKAPHLLMAGTTGSGKSVAVNAMIMSILLKSTPEEVRFIMVDPKMLELSVYEGIPHLLLPVVTDPKKAALALRWAVEEMERRYALLAEAGVRNIAGYNKLVETTHGELKRTPKPAQVIEAKAERIAAQKRADAPTREISNEPGPSAESATPSSSAPAANVPASVSASGKKPRKMMIIDVAAGESEEEALERIASGGPSIGVPNPHESGDEMREAVTGEEPAPLLADPLGDDVLKADVEDAGAEPALAPAAVEAAEEKKDELRKLPYIVVIIDELADLMMVASREVETYIARLAQMARAAGIHLMVATQRPSTDVVTGVIKANFPTRISFMLRSKPDSMTILGTVGAEALLGMGDMLIMPPTSAHMQRVHGAYVSEQEIHKVVEHLKAQGKPVYDESILKPREDESEGGGEEDDLSDELYDQALATVGEMKQVSISMLQRKMRIGYNRAARMIERMERDGVVGPADGARPREVLIRQLGEMPGAGAA